MFFETGHMSWLRRGNKEWHVPLHAVNSSDFALVELHRPNQSTNGGSTIGTGEVNAIDLKNHVKTVNLFQLVHMRMGCPGMKVMQTVIKEDLIEGLPTELATPEGHTCPISMVEKAVKKPARPMVTLLFLPVGVRFHVDFAFCEIMCIRGFKCFLVVSEAKTSYKWSFCRRNKHPPVKFLVWFVCCVYQRLNLPFANSGLMVVVNCGAAIK